MLSTKAKESIKTALAMTIAYGIALSLNWDKPYWAGFAVAFISLASIGQSLNKAALRMCGTLLAMAISLTLIALFSQYRWAFMIALSLVTGICCYMMSGKKHQYFWQATGFISVIICFDAGPDAANAFQIAVLRAQETGLGILVYSLVAIFLWPSHSRGGFDAAVAKLASCQHQLFRAYFNLASGKGNTQTAAQLKTQAVQAKAGFDQLLDAAQADNAEVWELRDAWRNYQFLATELMDVMGRWKVSIGEAKGLDLQRLLPGFSQLETELEERLTLIDQAIAGQLPERSLKLLELSVDMSAANGLGVFERSTLVATRDQMQQLERVTRALFDALGVILGFGATGGPVDLVRTEKAVFAPDLDRLANTMRFLAIIWVAFLALIYGGDIPGGTGFVIMAGSLGLALANMPQIPLSILYKPAAFSVAFAGALYIFVMPQLSSFMGLGLLMFVATFAICYRFAAPQQMLGRAFGLAMFVTIASISNHQSYSFLSVATTALMFPLIFLVLAITAYIPRSVRPERMFMRLLNRFFHSSDYLLSSMRRGPQQPLTRIERWKLAFHAREVATLPAKLNTWSPYLDEWVLSSNSKEQVMALINSLQLLGYHMGQLVAERNKPQAPLLLQQLAEDAHSWRAAIQGYLQWVARGPVVRDNELVDSGFDLHSGKLEQRISELLDNAPEAGYGDQEVENFYRLLGAYRGVSDALLDYAGNAGAIDWEPWHQERFA